MHSIQVTILFPYTWKNVKIINHHINNKYFQVYFLSHAFSVGLQLENVDPRVRKMYEGVRDVLAKYRSGKLPKAFKLLPKVRNWEQLLYITGKRASHLQLFFVSLKCCIYMTCRAHSTLDFTYSDCNFTLVSIMQ